MKKYIVTVDSLGFEGGVAKRGETVTEDQVGVDNVARLKADSALVDAPGDSPATPDAPAAPAAPEAPEAPKEDEPTDLKARLPLGLGPVEDHEFTDEEKAWIKDVKEGVEPVPFNSDAVLRLTAKEIASRIGKLSGTEGDTKKKKADLAVDLNAAVEAWFAEQEVE